VSLHMRIDKRNKIKQMYTVPKFEWLPLTEIWFGAYEWKQSRHTWRESLRERQKSSVSGAAAEIWRFGHFTKLPISLSISIYLSIYIYLSIIDYRNSPRLFSNATLPSPIIQILEPKLLWRHYTFVGHIPSKGNGFGTTVKILE